MKIVKMYEADDGKQFRSEIECLTHERLCKDAKAANNMLWNGATLMAVLVQANQARPWWDSGLTLEDKALLIKATKDTGFVIHHWQCSYKPGYKVCQIDIFGRIQLFGDVGSRDGPYGDWVSLRDLLRYAHQTAAQQALIPGG